MTIRINYLLPLLIVLFLAGLTLWLRFAVEQTGPQNTATNGHDADAIVENFTLIRMNTAGAPQYSMAARRMLHYPDSESTELELPRFTKRGADGATLSVTADRATITPDAGDARFRGNVLLRRDAVADRPALLARTEYLHLLAEQDLVQTDQRVTINEGNTVFTGVGMEINRATRQFTLHSQVKGSFDAIKRR